MWYLLVGILLLGVVTRVFSFLYDRKRKRMLEQGEIDSLDEPKIVDEECCGVHEVCERDSLLAAVSKEIEYYDDEELDAYCGIAPDAYPEDVVDEFREVLYTLREIEVAGWIRSLQLRGIHLPNNLKDEAFLILGERRM